MNKQNKGKKRSTNTIKSSFYNLVTLRMKLVGTNPNPQMKGLDEIPSKVNYFRGKAPKNMKKSTLSSI